MTTNHQSMMEVSEMEILKEENKDLCGRVSDLESKLEEEKARFREWWRTNCQCLAEYDALISDKDSEIKELKKQLSSLSPPPESLASHAHNCITPTTVLTFRTIVWSL